MAINRAILLDNLQLLCRDYGFRRETYYLAQSYVDAYLGVTEYSTATLELLGKTSLFIAMKMEEITPYRLDELCRPFEATEVEQMERHILNEL